MMKKNILVFPCGSEIGLDIYSSVCYSTHFHLIGGSSVDDHGKFVYDDYISNIPFATDKDFIPVLSKIVKERNVDAIYPAMDLIITILKEHEEELGCRVISSSLETTQICLSKDLTYKKLQGIVLTPQVYNSVCVPHLSFPVFAKPKVGYGAKGTKLLNNQQEVDMFVKGNEDSLMVLEYLPGEEYTVDCFTNKEGELLYCAARKRNRVKDGISVNTFFVEEQVDFEDIAKRINEKISFRGAWFYQVKRNKQGELCLLEIAPRIAGTMEYQRAFGVNLPLLSLYNSDNIKVDIIKNSYTCQMDRALCSSYRIEYDYNYIYIDLDDVLVQNSKVNYMVLAFIYKALNENKKIILLTRHSNNPIMTLEKYKIFNLFDEIIHIQDGNNKSNYIKHEDSIFIDDSHRERKDVYVKKRIPVFDVNMIDTLM